MLETRIQELKQMLISEAGLVEKMVSLSVDGLYKNIPSLLENVLALEDQVNQTELEIDDKCITTIALYQPEARDLRLILMIYRINNDLERLADQAVNISESTAHLMDNPVVYELPELEQMKSNTLTMLKNSLDALVKEDVALSHQVCSEDNTVDNLNRQIYHHLVELIQANPILTSQYLHLLRIAKNLERIADLSTNIAENTIYLAIGKVVRHRSEDIPPISS
ncbi:MAG TPA: phosphate signaling complex protein PhoU [Candidatus Syntrophosphaera thermopropionivorans]|jgi:phosphate transport system protein|uniref:Phosphate signaling complex protein PhoU n=1 Tax=Candidatus Syntrophosphaera thermopropionivorans TaxID=2593015 RepID=A0AC61QJC8_9BACT|nr:phosphate signaling complex protein PhoU [Candidatus Syntrophosphaera thermopropionivorans]MBP9006518.1 phosphate signaling complex protein PhoU [Candidatus Syntrophosphaera sp.]TDF73133.1 phosphate signaling complex protein PhoU [Candidatus Syntrophosphaera thermopropionivorans]HNZ45127.1 phosphate signaling complex protein PhoU [Candidatus Syntrophosphaera thermopropionivorans]HOH82167.1 phosphate signaling complex protein PhoU [Candidatus Syntrophosphaera thermopropionivorans]HON32875.1 